MLKRHDRGARIAVFNRGRGLDHLTLNNNSSNLNEHLVVKLPCRYPDLVDNPLAGNLRFGVTHKYPHQDPGLVVPASRFTSYLLHAAKVSMSPYFQQSLLPFFTLPCSHLDHKASSAITISPRSDNLPPQTTSSKSTSRCSSSSS
jgi:hypothetical protein